ncbi:hypothetical protein [Magnetospirillum sp. UT-4]|uniref:hypothetical protein n=1 Tax=Magnetospirillum sp. UT-4 TaxID=2681467 RepID=UPI0013856E83|nr:hypothetical protein [Magnetospirillum sp. UT-4]CAA7613503.1 hypothetical protein MTBUT4_150022 [Magnetospirillum sp. UT-4]
MRHACAGWSVVVAHPGERVGVGNVSNMGGLAYPNQVRPSLSLPRGSTSDPPGSPAAQQVARAIRNLMNQGKRVLIADAAKAVPGVKDANDILKGGA